MGHLADARKRVTDQHIENTGTTVLSFEKYKPRRIVLDRADIGGSCANGGCL